MYHGRETAAARAACPESLWGRARRRLDQLSAASRLADLAVPPGNRLHPLTGARSGQHAIRLDARNALCFVWTDDRARNVEVADARQPSGRPSPTKTIQADLVPTERQPTHPGEMLSEELLKPLKISQQELARLAGMSSDSAGLLLNTHGDVTPEIASRLARVFAMSAEFWLGLQQRWDAHQRRQVSWSAAAKAAKGAKGAKAARARGQAGAQVIDLASRRARGSGTETRTKAKTLGSRGPRAARKPAGRPGPRRTR